MREWEAATWATGKTESEVISRVGLAIASHCLELTRSGERILILAGKGHNGDDARAALPHLTARDVTCLNVTDPTSQLSELKTALALRPDLVIDALFGIGLNRPLDEAWQGFIAEINSAKLRVLAMDSPSGLNSDTGETFGETVQADITLTIGAPKRGLLSQSAWKHVGRLEVAKNVGLTPAPAAVNLIWVEAQDFADFPPRRQIAAHKGDFGHLGIVAGSLGYHGAAVLAARAAQRSHTGLVTLHTLLDVYHAVAAQLQGAMVRTWNVDTQLSKNFTALLVGPGLADPDSQEDLSKMTRKLWRDSETTLIVDASALDWIPEGSAPKGVVRVITPHPGEAARLLKTSSAKIQADRPAALREISRRFGDCWVVLKGNQTLVGHSTGDIAVNSSGNPLLAQGGSGDVLAGYIAGLMAQPALQREVATTLRYAVWQHGATADELTKQRPNWIVDELCGEIGNAKAKLPPIHK